VRLVAALLLLLAAVPARAERVLCYKATRLMWDPAAKRAVSVTEEMKRRLETAFGLWAKASRGALRFRFDGFEADGYDGTTDIPEDGCVHAVLHGERNFHGELAHGSGEGEIPLSYRRGWFFVSRSPGAASVETLAHEIGHALGLPHAATPESILFSGPRSARAPSEQDGADVRARWTPDDPGLYLVEGKIESARRHPVANVFLEPVKGGRSFSARADYAGRFKLAASVPGEYRLAARPVTMARDLNADALGGMTESWFVAPGESSASRAEAAVLTLGDSSRALSGVRLKTLDLEAPPAPEKASARRDEPVPSPGREEGPAPVFRLSFDRGFDDEGPSRLRAKAEGDEVRLVPGLVGQALFVGGTEDWLDVALPPKLALPRGFSLELWLRRADWTNPYRGGSGWQTVAALTIGATLSVTAPGCPLHAPWALEGSVSRFHKGGKGEDVARAHSPGGLVRAGRWTHAAVVYDPAERSLTVYLDGRAVDRAKAAPEPDLRFPQLRLGTWHKANQAFRGEIDEVAVYDFPRSAEAVARAAGASR
jgi:hypothetical protein